MESLVSPTTLVDQAYAVILDAICDGTLKPGERLTQADVAERLNVSRQPIHNALLVLKAQGFVQETGRRGLCVAPLDPALFEAIYQFRSAIEPLAVRLATARMTPADLARGHVLIAQGMKAVKEQGGAAVRADMAFHSWIYDLSGNVDDRGDHAAQLAASAPRHGRGAAASEVVHAGLERASRHCRHHGEGRRREGRPADRRPCHVGL